jgi:peptidoglycan hydrolase CwlO-like protein
MNSVTVVEPERCVGTARWRELFDMDEPIQVQIARLESDVQHIQTVVSDIKADLRRIDDKIDATNNRVDVLRDKLGQGIRDVGTRIDGVREKLAEKIDGVRHDLTQKVEGMRQDLTKPRG